MYDLCVRVALLVAAGCGRLAFDQRAADASLGDGADARACTWSAFSAPLQLPAIVQSGADDWFPTPSLGSLLFYSYRGTSYGQIFEAARDPLGTPAIHGELSQGTFDIKWPTLTNDGLTIIYGAFDGVGFNLWQASRAAPTGAFSSPAQLSISAGSYDFSGFVSGDGLRLVFISERDGSAMLYETTRGDRSAAFATPRAHAELGISSSGGPNAGPTMSADGLDVYYSASPSGQYDVYTAHRTALDQPFGAGQLVPELSGPGDDIGLRLSAEGDVMYLNSDAMANGGGNAQMWTATRTCN